MKPSVEATIAIVCGGPSSEAEVSRTTGKCIAEALEKTYPKVVTLELDRDLPANLQRHSVDVAFPALHGPPGEDGTMQGFLEIAGLPYVGSGVRASAFAMDKSIAKCIFKRAGLPVAKDVIVHRSIGTSAALKEIERTLGQDVVIKPLSQGSAVGVAFASTGKELEDLFVRTWDRDNAALIEERIFGREITVGVLDLDEIQAFPVIEVRTPKGTWYDFEHRYAAGASEHVIPASLPADQYRRTQEIALLAHKALGCRDLSRADFVVPEKGEPILLEVNTLPGMTPTSLYPDGARAADIGFEKLVAMLIERALIRRHGVFSWR